MHIVYIYICTLYIYIYAQSAADFSIEHLHFSRGNSPLCIFPGAILHYPLCIFDWKLKKQNWPFNVQHAVAQRTIDLRLDFVSKMMKYVYKMMNLKMMSLVRSDLCV